MRLSRRLAAGLSVTAAVFWSAGAGLTSADMTSAAAATSYTPLPAHV